MANLGSDAREPVVKTMNGPIRGRWQDGLFAFRGIRYGAPPTGAARFKPSRRPQPWTDPVDAFAFGHAAMQMSMGIVDASGPSPMKEALMPILPQPEDKASESEDCLFLNVWSPGLGDGKNRAVMIWFHGGGYAAGSGSWPVYDCASLARRGDVVVVSVNHRLNVFGYFFLGELAGMEYVQSGNAGMTDLLLAIMWVRDHISAFGGDPHNVTLFGESGGGFKVSTLLAMPSTKNIIHKAIIQSGPGVRCLTREAATESAHAILTELGLTMPKDIERLRQIPASNLVAAAHSVQAKMGPALRMPWLAPVMDGVTMPAQPFEPKAPAVAAKIPLLVGHTRDEGTFFLAADPQFGRFGEDDLTARAKAIAGDRAGALLAALRKERPRGTPSEILSDLLTAIFMFAGSVSVAERKAAQEAPVYAYRLDWRTPVLGGMLGATHALDLPLMFGSVEKARAFVGEGTEPNRVADQMTSAWIAFAKTGDPNTPGLPEWPRYDTERRATMLFDAQSRVADDPWGEVRKVLVG